MPDLFPDGPYQTPLRVQIDCVEREIRYRRHVYPRLVAKGRISQAKADYEIRVMEAVVVTLKDLKQKEDAA